MCRRHPAPCRRITAPATAGDVPVCWPSVLCLRRAPGSIVRPAATMAAGHSGSGSGGSGPHHHARRHGAQVRSRAPPREVTTPHQHPAPGPTTAAAALLEMVRRSTRLQPLARGSIPCLSYEPYGCIGRTRPPAEGLRYPAFPPPLVVSGCEPGPQRTPSRETGPRRPGEPSLFSDRLGTPSTGPGHTNKHRRESTRQQPHRTVATKGAHFPTETPRSGASVTTAYGGH